MKFETKVISIEEQIACIGRVIESYSGIIRVFDEDRMQEQRDEMAKDILELMAARESLRRVIGQRTAVSVPRPHKQRPNYDPPGQGESPGKNAEANQGGLSAADVERFLQNSATMRAMRSLGFRPEAGAEALAGRMPAVRQEGIL